MKFIEKYRKITPDLFVVFWINGFSDRMNEETLKEVLEKFSEKK